MTTMWILVADNGSARLYSAIKAKLIEGNGELELVETYDHDEGRKRSSELVSDKPGRYIGGASGAHGAYQSTTSPAEHESEVFAKKLAEILNTGRVDQAYEALIIIAPSQFQGTLSKHLNSHVNNLLMEAIHKDYTGCDKKQLLKHLEAYL